MRVSELADLTGTTVRAIRHYQALGLLPVPESDGRRRYDMSHVARLSRIRWLAAAGLPLVQVREMLETGTGTGTPAGTGTGTPYGAGSRSGSRSGVLDDLRAALAAVDAQAVELARQRERLAALVARAEEGDGLTPMPRVIARFYERAEHRATDERTLAAIRAERDLVEVACYRGELPTGAELVFEGYDDAALAASVAAFGRDSSRMGEAEIEQLAADNVARIRSRLGDGTAALARSVDVEAVRRFYGLVLAHDTDPASRRLGEAMLRQLLAAIAEWRDR